MVAYWPSAPTDDTVNTSARRLTHFMNDTRKLVFSRTLTTAAAWANSVVADGEVGEVLAREKAAPGRDLVIFGGAAFAQSVGRTGLIDEYAILTIPTLFGGGSRLFGDSGVQRALDLVDVRRMDTGAVLTRYATRVLPSQ
jgi:dihydrofolate reductase